MLLDLNTAERRVFQALWAAKRSVSRKELVQFTRLSKATISRTVKSLMSKLFILETNQIFKHRKGRPHTLLKLNEKLIAVGGILIRSKFMEISLGNLAGEVKHYLVVKHSRKDVLDYLTQVPKIITENFSMDISQLLVFSIVTPGLVDVNRGTVTNSFYTMEETNLKELTNSWGTVVQVENDANALLLAKMLLGEIPEVDSIYIDKGFGASFILNGQIFRGPSGGAGEFGHMQIDLQGPKCWCGKRGCVSAHFNSENLKEYFKKILPPRLMKTDDSQFLELLNRVYTEEENQDFDEQFERLLEKLAAAIGNVLDLLGIDTVVLNSENPLFCGRAMKYLSKKISSSSIHHTKINLISIESDPSSVRRVPVAISMAKIIGRI